MQIAPAIYLGRILSEFDKQYFRVYIYSADGLEKLVNSWDEYERHIALGTWFATKAEADNSSIASNAAVIARKNEKVVGYKK